MLPENTHIQNVAVNFPMLPRVYCWHKGVFLYTVLTLRRPFSRYYKQTHRSPILRKLTTFFWLLFPALALAAPQSPARARLEGSHSVLLAQSDSCVQRIPAKSGIDRPERTLRGLSVNQQGSPHRRHRRRQLAAAPDRLSLLPKQKPVQAQASEIASSSRPFFLLGRSPPCCC